MTEESKKDPFAIFECAEAFGRAADILYRASSGDGWQNITSVVYRAFQLELYFKCLLRLEGKTSTKTHALLDLFSQLSAETAEAIRRYHRQLFEPPPAMIDAARQVAASRGYAMNAPITVDDKLKDSSDAFQHLRYIYEGPSEKCTWCANEVITSTRMHIVNLYPEWVSTQDESQNK
jgi:hypothetical protein